MTSENHSNAQQPAPSADEVTDAGIVKEYTTPLKHEIDPDINLFDFLEGRAAQSRRLHGELQRRQRHLADLLGY